MDVKAKKLIYDSNGKSWTDLVDSAETAFYSSKIQVSTSCKEPFHNINTI